MGLQDRVQFTGWRQDLPEVYAAIDLIVCCSFNEGTPVSVIEAGAARRAVVGSRVGGMPDIIQDGVNGILVPSGDAEALATAIESLVKNPERAAEMGRAGRARALENHSSERMVSDLRSLYGRLLEASAR
jgi:glycosyltransferase involved in cell wall biosynthesis